RFGAFVAVNLGFGEVGEGRPLGDRPDGCDRMERCQRLGWLRFLGGVVIGVVEGREVEPLRRALVGRRVGRVGGARRGNERLGEGGGQVVGERRGQIVVSVLDEGVLDGRRVVRWTRLPLGEGGVQVLVVGPIGYRGRGSPLGRGGLVLDVRLVLGIPPRGGRGVAVDGAQQVRQVRHVL